MIKKTQRWLDSLVELIAVRFIAWVSIAVTTYPGLLVNPWKLANWFDDHALWAYEESDRSTLLHYHQLPVWNPFWCGGKTGISEPEDSFYSPDFLLRLIFDAEHGRRFAVLLFVVLGLEGTYRLCRKLDSTAVASAFAAIVFATQDRFVSFVHDGWVHFMSFELVPWVLLALWQGIESKRWRVVGGFFLAWIVLAPGTYPAPYTAIAFGYCFGAIALYRFFRKEPKPFSAPLLSAFTIGVVGLLLCMCKLLPTMSYMVEFPRVFNMVETHPANEIIANLVPRYSVIVLLALVAAVFGDVAGGIFIGGALLFFALSLGDFGHFSPFFILKKIPVLNALRYPDRFIVMVVLFTSIAASRGLSKLEDAIPQFARASWAWVASLPIQQWAKRVTGRELRALQPMAPEIPREIVWIFVGLAAILSYRVVEPSAEELVAAQRAPSMGLYVEEAPHRMDAPFRQGRGNRRDAHIFPPLNIGSLNCVAGIPIPESDRLLGDLPQEEYPSDPNVASVKRVSWSPNKIVLDVDAKSATSIFINQNYDRKWRTNIGQTRSEERMLAVDVPAGHNQVELEYRDNMVYLSLLITVATWLVILYFGAKQLIRRIKKEWAGFNDLPMFPPSS